MFLWQFNKKRILKAQVTSTAGSLLFMVANDLKINNKNDGNNDP